MSKSILETILEPSELHVVFQPIFRIEGQSRSVDSVEALIRGPRGTNFERADILFDYVRRKKAEAAVDQSCIAAICDAAELLPTGVRINVNVHASTLGHNMGFADFLRRQVQKHALALERFTVELVEYAPTCNIPELMNNLTRLRDWGVRIALDDVGAGQSNYRMMLDCHPDYFKLDAYFVRDLGTDPKRCAVVESVVALANALDSLVVAEGVPSNEDLSHLEAIGVELAQANLLCPAISLKQLLATDFFCDPAFGTPPTDVTAVHNSHGVEREHAFAKAAAASQSFYT
ncbi:MAG: EAL domain-containing protein [Terriglobales bacterium]|jgi:EAL domain-containing protein (putative c-di-GMP-specific phosphodiesterase class I)